jgi:hypothetical protein
MARTTITPIVAPGAYAGALTTFAWVDLGVTGTNGHQFTLTGAEVILVKNISGAGVAVQLFSVDDQFGRQENVLSTIAASGYSVIGPMKQEGWLQTDGNFYLDSTSTAIKAAVIKVPGL